MSQGTVYWNWWSRASACGYVQEFCPFQIHPEVTVHHALTTRKLSKSLTLANKSWPRVATDVRIASLLKNIGKQYLGRDYLSTLKASGQVTPDQLDLVRYTPTCMFHRHAACSSAMTPLNPQLAARSMPLCMNHLHSELKRAHHLKHWGRLQYVLFLKGIGLTLEYCLDFWRQEFTKRITLEDFQQRFRLCLFTHCSLTMKRSSTFFLDMLTGTYIMFAMRTAKRASAKTTLLTVVVRLFSGPCLPVATPMAVRLSTGMRTIFAPNYPK